MEVTTALGVISFALIALLGVFPLGIENSRQCVSETRASQLIGAISATLMSEPFKAAPCFSTTASPIDLSLEKSWALPGVAAAGVPVVLYVSYDVGDTPHITRESSANAIYKVELRFKTETLPGLATGAPPVTGTPPAAPIVGSTVLVRMTDISGVTGQSWAEIMQVENGTPKYKKGLVLQTQIFVPSFSRLAYLK
jgi:hypothetical protein